VTRPPGGNADAVDALTRDLLSLRSDDAAALLFVALRGDF